MTQVSLWDGSRKKTSYSSYVRTLPWGWNDLARIQIIHGSSTNSDFLSSGCSQTLVLVMLVVSVYLQLHAKLSMVSLRHWFLPNESVDKFIWCDLQIYPLPTYFAPQLPRTKRISHPRLRRWWLPQGAHGSHTKHHESPRIKVYQGGSRWIKVDQQQDRARWNEIGPGKGGWAGWASGRRCALHPGRPQGVHRRTDTWPCSESEHNQRPGKMYQVPKDSWKSWETGGKLGKPDFRDVKE